MSEIKWNLKTFKISELTDYYKNPRQLNEKQFNQLKNNLEKLEKYLKDYIRKI